MLLRMLKNIRIIIHRNKARNAYYGKFLIEYGSISQIYHSFDWLSTKSSYRTKKEIALKGDLRFGASKEEVKHRFGKPLFIFSNPLSEGHEILFYKCRLGQNIINCEIHFYESILFMGVYTSDSLLNRIFEVKKYFLEEYIGANHLPESHEDFHITDKNQNSIYVTDTTNLQIVYLNRFAAITPKGIKRGQHASP